MCTSVRLSVVSLCVLLAACSRPPEAPADFAEIAAFLFERFDDEDTRDIALGIENLEVWLAANLHATEGDSLTDGYTVSSLDPAVILSVRPESEIAVDGEIAGSSVAREFVFSGPEIAQALAIDEQEDIFKAYNSHERTFLTDRACFVPMTCDWLDTTNVVDGSYAGGTLNIASESQAQFRWLPYGDEAEGKTAFLRRTWLIAPPATTGALGGLFDINEQLYMGITIPWQGGTIQVGTTWVSVKILVDDINEGFALSTMVNTMGNQADELAEYLDGGSATSTTD